MALDPLLLEILVCPETKKALLYFEKENFLFCPESRLKYRIEDDIPVMLIEEAERLDEAAAEALIARAKAR
ncbi:MAG TPA: Trm112 family protein [Candidatus Binatia bacterium]|nr:Trm112 family protein [Candidatus Binatia bacterium]